MTWIFIWYMHWSLLVLQIKPLGQGITIVFLFDHAIYVMQLKGLGMFLCFSQLHAPSAKKKD